MAVTETYGPFDGVTWTQSQWYRNAPTWAPSGVIDTPSSGTTTGGFGLTFNGLTANVAAGRAWVRGGGYELAGGSKALTIAANTNSSLSRIDRIVLRRDLSAKAVTMIVLQGAPAGTPATPALSQVETGQWDVPLFNFLVPPNSGTVISGVADERVWIDPDGGQVHRKRQWYFGRTGNVSDTIATTGTPVVLMAATITGAASGEYEITSREVISGTVTGAGFQSITCNAADVAPSTGTPDPRADIMVAEAGGTGGPRHTFVQTVGYTHAGGDLTVKSFYENSSGGTFTVWSQGTEITVTYLGPS